MGRAYHPGENRLVAGPAFNDMPVNRRSKAAGVGVVQVVPGSPADRASLRPGDIIVSLDGTTVSSIDEIHRFLSQATIGSAVRVGVLRNGQRLYLPAHLASSPE